MTNANIVFGAQCQINVDKVLLLAENVLSNYVTEYFKYQNLKQELGPRTLKRRFHFPKG